MNIDPVMTGGAGEMPAPDAEAGLLGAPVLGEAWVPGQPASVVPGNEVSGTEDLERDAAAFAALMEKAPEPGAPERPLEPEEGKRLSSMSAVLAEAMASYRTAQTAEAAQSAAPNQAEGVEAGSGARLENTIQTISNIDRLVEQISVSLPSAERPVVVLRLAEDILGGAEVRLEIAEGTLQVVFSDTAAGTNAFAGLDFQDLGNKLVDCAGGRDVEVTIDCGETGEVETWRFPRESSRQKRGRKESEH